MNEGFDIILGGRQSGRTYWMITRVIELAETDKICSSVGCNDYVRRMMIERIEKRPGWKWYNSRSKFLHDNGSFIRVVHANQGPLSSLGDPQHTVHTADNAVMRNWYLGIKQREEELRAEKRKFEESFKFWDPWNQQFEENTNKGAVPNHDLANDDN